MKKLDSEKKNQIFTHLEKAATFVQSALPLVTQDLGMDFSGNQKTPFVIQIILEAASVQLNEVMEILKQPND